MIKAFMQSNWVQKQKVEGTLSAEKKKDIKKVDTWNSQELRLDDTMNIGSVCQRKNESLILSSESSHASNGHTAESGSYNAWTGYLWDDVR